MACSKMLGRMAQLWQLGRLTGTRTAFRLANRRLSSSFGIPICRDRRPASYSWRPPNQVQVSGHAAKGEAWRHSPAVLHNVQFPRSAIAMGKENVRDMDAIIFSAYALGFSAVPCAETTPARVGVFLAQTRCGRVERLKSQHSKALKNSGVKPFVLYSLRHTMLTRLGESGAEAFTIQKIAGHSSAIISQRYVHPTPTLIENAFSRLEAYNRAKEAELERGMVQ